MYVFARMQIGGIPKMSTVVLLQHRRLLYDLFTKNYRVKRSMVQARLAQEFGDAPKSEVDRLLHVRWAAGGLNISVFETASSCP